MPSSAAKLFHAVVVLGASAGCGGSTVNAPETPAQDASARAIDSASTTPPDAGPRSLCDCARPGAFRCRACASGVAPFHGRCPGDDGVDCSCDETIAVAAPGDCAHPEQFVCNTTQAYQAGQDYGVSPDQWYAFADCACDATRPFSMTECTDGGTTLMCAMGYGCPSGPVPPGDFASNAPSDRIRYACACLPPATPIH